MNTQDNDGLTQPAAPVTADGARVGGRSGSHAGSPAPVSFRAPELVALGDYELLGEIARGGMGAVHRARQVSLNRQVAVKVILAGEFASAAELRRFRTEAEAVGGLNHPNIVPIYEVGEEGGRHFFSMKLVEGGSLSARVKEFSAPKAAAALLATVARAVHHAHAHGFLHRDLKPGNILLDADGTPHVADFGLAKRLDGAGHDQTLTGVVMGTPAYMSPEQARGESKRLTTATDIYSLGAILYQLLTGQPPFTGESVMEVLRQTLEAEPIPPGKLVQEVDRDLESICLKCLDKEPARRYGSALALAEDLECWLRLEPVTARPVTTIQRAIKWTRRRPAVAAFAAATTVATLAGLAGTLWQLRQKESALVAVTEQRNKATAAELRARQEADIAKAINEFFTKDVLAQASPSQQPDRDLKLRTVLDQSAVRIGDRFKDMPAVEASIRHTLGQAYIELSDFTAAREHLERAVALRRRALGETNLATADALFDLGRIYRRLNLMAEAEAASVAALRTHERELGSNAPAVVVGMSNLANILGSTGRVERALALREEAHRREKVAHGQRAYASGVAVDLAYDYARVGRVDEAEALLSKSVAALRETRGAKSIVTMLGMNNLAGLWDRQGKTNEALALLEETWSLRREVLGVAHQESILTATGLANWYQRRGRLADAERLYALVAEGWPKIYGPDNYRSIEAKFGHASILLRLGQTDRAIEMGRNAVRQSRGHAEISASTQSSRSLSLAGWLAKRAATLQAADRLADSEKDFLEEYELRAKAPNPNPKSLADCARRVAAFYRAWGKPDIAKEWDKRLAP